MDPYGINVWDDGYPSGGNYWSDYAGVDEKSGPNQDQTGSDGIGDTPYIIDADNTDRYPLMDPIDVVPPTTTHDYDGLWHTVDFTINLKATDNLSGVAETYYKINNGPTKTVSADGQPLITTESANNKLEYWSVDNADNEESHHILTGIKLDKTIPTGSFTINDGATYATSTSVTLTLSAADATSGVYRVRFSNDGIWDTETWEEFSTTKAWTLTSGDGTKTVFYQIKDNAGLTSQYQDTVILDTTKPTANAGQDQTVNVGETVNFDAGASSDNVGIVSYEWDFGDQTTGTGKTTTHTYTSQGAYTAKLTVKDSAGNSATDTITVTVLPEEAPPPPTEPFPIWIVGIAIAAIGIATAAILLLRKRK